MNILALDTSNSSLSICIKTGDDIRGEINLNNGLVHSTTLMPCIENLFNTVNFDKKTLDMVVVSIGPGSFTGIRIGVATANAISMALNIPVISVKSLDALAMNFLYFDGIIISTIYAQRDNFYVGVYKSDYKNLTDVKENIIMSEEELKSYISSSKDRIVLCGDACSFINDDKTILCTSSNNYIKASNLAVLGEKIYEKEKTSSFATPVYMRKSQAEIVYEQKQN